MLVSLVLLVSVVVVVFVSVGVVVPIVVPDFPELSELDEVVATVFDAALEELSAEFGRTSSWV